MAHSFKTTDMALLNKALSILRQNLSYTEMLRFLAIVSAGEGDYLAWQDKTFGQVEVDDFYKQAASHWERRHPPRKSSGSE